jgi:histidine triad (HIT) family protein
MAQRSPGAHDLALRDGGDRSGIDRARNHTHAGALMADDCLFCRIVRGEIPAAVVHKDDHLVAFRDINPQAPVHVVIVPREHVATLNDATDVEMLGRLSLAASEIARREGIADSGYRTVVNTNRAAGQTVFHIHLHLLGGRSMAWPPG